jgi:NADH-quinone oxidoreductase subunit H
VFAVLFMGGWQPLPFVTWANFAACTGLPLNVGLVGGLLSVGMMLAKIAFFIFVFIWVRWSIPRFRYDQVMRIGWRILLPMAVINVLVYAIAVAFLPN